MDVETILGLMHAHMLTAQAESYRVTDADPTSLEFTDGDWDGSQARQSMPNPSDDDTDLSILDQSFVFVPEGDDARDAKGNWVCPFRQEPGAPAHVSGLVACLAAINGARGGIDGISDDTLRDGYDWVVDALVEVGHYDDADEAPDFEAAAAQAVAELLAQDGFEPAREMDGMPLFQSRAPAEQAAEFIGGDCTGAHEKTVDGDTWYVPCSDDETAQDAFASRADCGCGGDGDDPDDVDGLEAADPRTVELTAEATGTVSTDRDPSTLLEAADVDGDGGGLKGIIWGAGDHDLSLGGEGTPVRVPAETIPPTFEALKEDVEAGEVTLGFDHPGRDSVAAKTGIVDIGTATDVALAQDEQHIVLTGSELTNDQAAEAAEAGDFDDLDWSVVADVRVRRTDDGDPVVEDGRVILDATRIRRIDAVNDGAVDAASIERSTDALPDLKSELQTIQQAAQTPNHDTISAAADALQASADALDNHDMKHFDPDEYDDVQAALEAASDVVDERQDRIDTLAGAFEDVLEAADGDVDVDFDDIDVTESPEAAAQAVIDAQTADLRREIAELEADLASFDTTEGDVDDRAEALKGKSAQDLRAQRNDRAYQQMQVQQKKQTRGAAAAQTDTTGRSTATAGNSNGDADDLALSAMDGADRVHADAAGKSPSQYLQDQYGINAADYDDADALRADVVEAATGDA